MTCKLRLNKCLFPTSISLSMSFTINCWYSEVCKYTAYNSEKLIFHGLHFLHKREL